MKSKIILLLFLLFSRGIMANSLIQDIRPLDSNENEIGYFLSFSIPEKQLVTLIKGAENKNIPVYIRGLVRNDMRATTKAILYLATKYNIKGVLVDPLRFDYYGVDTVPALVKKCGDKFDIIFGNVDIGQALNELELKGDCKK